MPLKRLERTRAAYKCDDLVSETLNKLPTIYRDYSQSDRLIGDWPTFPPDSKPLLSPLIYRHWNDCERGEH